MKPALVVAAGLFLVLGAIHRPEHPAPARCGDGQLENELSLVQIEQMRVISPDSIAAERLSHREEQLKYKLLGSEITSRVGR
jgi:hypothetical protein